MFAVCLFFPIHHLAFPHMRRCTNMHHRKLVVLFCGLFATFPAVRANTEIVNFGVSYEDDVELAEATRWCVFLRVHAVQ